MLPQGRRRRRKAELFHSSCGTRLTRFREKGHPQFPRQFQLPLTSAQYARSAAGESTAFLGGCRNADAHRSIEKRSRTTGLQPLPAGCAFPQVSTAAHAGSSTQRRASVSIVSSPSSCIGPFGGPRRCPVEPLLALFLQRVPPAGPRPAAGRRSGLACKGDQRTQTRQARCSSAGGQWRQRLPPAAAVCRQGRPCPQLQLL